MHPCRLKTVVHCSGMFIGDVDDSSPTFPFGGVPLSDFFRPGKVRTAGRPPSEESENSLAAARPDGDRAVSASSSASSAFFDILLLLMNLVLTLPLLLLLLSAARVRAVPIRSF